MYKYNLEPLLNNAPFSRQGFHEMEIRFLSFYNNACPLFLQGSNFFFFFESSGFFHVQLHVSVMFHYVFFFNKQQVIKISI